MKIVNDFWRDGRQIVKMLIDAGYDAYFARDAVIDRISEREISLIWIVTTANITVLKKMFPESLELTNYKDTIIVNKDGRTFVLESLKFDLTNIAPDPKGHYSTVIVDGLGNMEYTIDSIIISYSDKIFDPFLGLEDLNKHKLVFIGDTQVRIEHDPFIILKGLRLMAKYGCTFSSKDEKIIKKFAHVLVRLSFKDYAFFLEEITKGEYARLAFKKIYSLDVYKYLPQFKDALEIINRRSIALKFEEILLLTSVVNDFIDPEYAFYINNYDAFKKAKHLAIANPACKYDMLELFTYGLDVALLANKMNYLIGLSSLKTGQIKRKFNKLKIKRICDLVFKGEDILKITDQDGEYLGELVDEIAFLVLKGKLRNDYMEIKDFVLKRLPELGIDVISDEKYKPIYQYDEDSLTDIQDIDQESFMKNLMEATDEKEVYDALKKQGRIFKKIVLNSDPTFSRHQEIDYFIFQKIDDVLRANFVKQLRPKRYEIMQNLFRDYVKFFNQLQGSK